MEAAAADAITERLSTLGTDALKLPASMLRDRQPTAEEVAQHLMGLLHRDAGVFVERHGRLLTAEELHAFAPLRATSFEVDHWIRLLEASSGAEGDISAAAPRLSATVKNRRLAALRQLEREGAFFSQDSMRERAPLLYHEHIGRFEAVSGGAAPPPTMAAGESLVDGLLRAHDQERRQLQLQSELQQEAGQVSESEDGGEAEDEGGGATAAAEASSGRCPERGAGESDSGGEGWESSAEVEQRRQQQFLTDMHQRFLSGEEGAHVDYAAIDANTHLDEEWAEQEARDAEDRYFSDDA